MRLSPGEIEGRARALFGEPNVRLSTARDLRFGRHGSISVVLQGERAGLWYDHESGRGGSVLTTGECAPRPSGEPRRGPLTWDSDSADKLEALLRSGLCPVEDAHTRASSLRPDPRSPAQQYLASRGIDRWPHSIRGWHRAGIAYLAQTADGSILAAQVLPLTPDGRKDRARWSDGVTKRTWSACRGWHHYAAVRLPGRGEPVLCEGVETGLSIWLATGRPVACCLGRAGFIHLRIGKRMTIARDGDEPGSQADTSLVTAIADRRKRGQRVRVASPPLGQDFNDVHMADGLSAVAKLIRGAV